MSGSSGKKSSLSGHLAGLDGVRGLAILGVMAVHFVGDATPQNFAERVAVKLGNYGVLGVDLFFVLSGFLITGLLVDAKGSPYFFRNFYARRTLRIFPLYYFVLALLFYVLPRLMALPEPLEEARHHQSWLWLYGTNFYLASKAGWALGHVSHFWSLAIEEHFYLVWPLVVFLLQRRTLERVCLVIVGVTFALRLGLSLAGVNAIALQVMTPCRVDSLCFGGFLALLARREEGLEPVLRLAGPLALMSGAALLGLSSFLAATDIHRAALQPLRVSLFAIFFGALTVISLKPAERSLIARAFQSRTLRTFGKYSYGLYVYHGVLSYQMIEIGTEHRLGTFFGSHSAGIVAQTVLGVGASLFISVLSYELFEKRVLALKRHFETPPRTEPIEAKAPAPVDRSPGVAV